MGSPFLLSCHRGTQIGPVFRAENSLTAGVRRLLDDSAVRVAPSSQIVGGDFFGMPCNFGM